MNDKFYKSLFFSPVNYSEIYDITQSLKNSFSGGHDETSSHLLKKIIRLILIPLTHSFNLSLSTGVYPHSFKKLKYNTSSNIYTRKMTQRIFQIIVRFHS